MKTDIVIVGSGCSGLYCAYNLPRDKEILIITKDIVEHSDSYLAQGGMCMLTDEEDYDSYFYDTMRAGHFGFSNILLGISIFSLKMIQLQ